MLCRVEHLWDYDGVTDAAALVGDGGPRWRVRVARSPGLRRWTDRRLAHADVTTPSGHVYGVRIKRNWPIAKSPLGPLDSILPYQVSLGALLAANALKRGRTGWTVEVVSPPTAWRSERVLHARRSHNPERILHLATTIIDAISAGRDPSDFDDDLTTGARLRRLFDWD